MRFTVYFSVLGTFFACCLSEAQEKSIKIDPSKYKWEDCRYEKSTMNNVTIPFSCNGRPDKTTVFAANVVCKTTIEGGKKIEVSFVAVCPLDSDGKPFSVENCRKDATIDVQTIYPDAPLPFKYLSE